jgi:hypothetical protein
MLAGNPPKPVDDRIKIPDYLGREIGAGQFDPVHVESFAHAGNIRAHLAGLIQPVFRRLKIALFFV